uniref:Uncharacterized protein n=1 Tax=Rhipilia penicilloides TaxID=1979422 RepID=A0A2P0QHN7_9CHLO|nr:hypothetical protein [Rhipilia penicilloides]ARO74266.1 hypothetical protein [Rhipilia penicilloides]
MPHSKKMFKYLPFVPVAPRSLERRLRWHFFFQSLFLICFGYFSFSFPARGLESRAPIFTVQTQQARDQDDTGLWDPSRPPDRSKQTGADPRGSASQISGDWVFEPVRAPSGLHSVVFVPKGHNVATLALQPSKKRSLTKALIISGGMVLTWKMWNHYFRPWPQMSEIFYNQLQTVIENKKGDLDHVPIIEEALTEFLNSPPQRRAVKHKISHILANPHHYFENLEMFYFSPLRWIELLDKKTITLSNRAQTQLYLRSIEVENLIQEFDQNFVDFNTNCEGTLTYETIEKFKYTEDQDIRDYILEFENIPLHDLTENFQGEQGLFNFLLRRLMVKFWRGAFLISFRI